MDIDKRVAEKYEAGWYWEELEVIPVTLVDNDGNDASE